MERQVDDDSFVLGLRSPYYSFHRRARHQHPNLDRARRQNLTNRALNRVLTGNEATVVSDTPHANNITNVREWSHDAEIGRHRIIDPAVYNQARINPRFTPRIGSGVGFGLSNGSGFGFSGGVGLRGLGLVGG